MSTDSHHVSTEQQQTAAEHLDVLVDEAIASGPAIEYTPDRWRQKRHDILMKLGIAEETTTR